MRPVRLEMTAFGPFAGMEVVDFRELGESCFFLIHGPTGAGKTSVLDGMCFALYGQGTGSEREAKFMRSDFAREDVATHLVFDFTIGPELYRISRRLKQDRRNANGTVSQVLPQATLWRRTGAANDTTLGEVLADGVTAVGEKITGLLGFSVEQFRQVVMIPQGEFRKLLSAKSADRQEILEQLFNARLYGQLETFLKDKASVARRDLAAVHQQLAGVFGQLEVTDHEQLLARLDRARGDLIDARQTAETATAEADAAARRLEAGKQISTLFERCVQAGGRLETCLGLLDTAQQTFTAAAGALDQEHSRDPERDAARTRVADLEKIAGKATALSEAETRLKTAQAAVTTAGDRLAAAEASESDLRGAVGACGDKLKAALEAAALLPRSEALLNEATALLTNVVALARWQRRNEVRAAKVAQLEAAALAAADRRDAARQGLRTLQEHWRTGQAGMLARTLLDGQPCPVCGSAHHPAPATAASDAPAEDELETAQSGLDGLDRLAAAAMERHQKARQRLAAAEATLKTIRVQMGGGAGADRAGLESRIDGLRQEIKPLQDLAQTIPALERDLAAIQERHTAAGEAAQTARQTLHDAQIGESSVSTVHQERLKEVPEEYRLPQVLAQAISEAKLSLQRLDSALKQAEEAKQAAGDRLIRAEADEQHARTAANEAAKAVEGRQLPDVEALQQDADRGARDRNDALMAFGQAKTRHREFRQGEKRVAALRAESDALEQRFRSVALLADMASGQNSSNISFQRYVLAVVLGEVLDTATHRLLGMTNGRYHLQTAAAGTGDRRRAAGLDLEVLDEFTGEARPVGTLSGGEGFLASLALALALAEVVQRLSGGIRLDAVFIDEGFGTLSPEALDAAIDTLLALREHDRLVGVISHVPELKERIDCRLELIPSKTGSTTRFTVP